MIAGYHGARFALLTQHGKEQAIAPAFTRVLGARVLRVAGVDTDALGTFTREIPRPGTQLETAATKARVAREHSGLAFGLGSEGAFVPATFCSSWNLELVVLDDGDRDVQIVGRAEGPGHHVQHTLLDLADLQGAATAAGFPEHGLTVRPSGADGLPVYKDLDTYESLHAACERASRQSLTGTVWLESDLRAHRNPARMRRIAIATADLLERMQRSCPACASPGFGRIGFERGLPCFECNDPTEAVAAELHGCTRCSFTSRVPVERTRVPAYFCPSCNP